jgi:hypothetical protein
MSRGQGKDIGLTLLACKPSLTHLFGAEEAHIEKASDALKTPKASSWSAKSSFKTTTRRTFDKDGGKKRSPYSKPRPSERGYTHRNSKGGLTKQSGNGKSRPYSKGRGGLKK